MGSDSDIKRDEEAFRRSAELDANRITVEAHGGEVVPKGTVRSWAERQEAERAAWAGRHQGRQPHYHKPLRPSP